MRKLLLLFTLALGYFALPASAAVVTVCASGCDTTSLQTALNTTAACGDTISIKSTETQTGNFTITYRGCSAETPITVTSDRCEAGWAPPVGGKPSPSHLTNFAVIQGSGANNDPALKDALDGSNRPPAHWVFKCIAFRPGTAGTYFPVLLNSYSATQANRISDDITFDRDYFYTPLPNNVNRFVQTMLRGDATNIVIKNSFFGDNISNNYTETKNVQFLTNPGPFTVTNNYFTTLSTAVFGGGAIPSYATYIGNGGTVRYNYSYRPWKFFPDPLQPYASQWATNVQNTARFADLPISGITNDGIVTYSGGTFVTDNGALLTISGVGGCTVANASYWRMTTIDSTHVQLLNFPGCNSAYTSGGEIDEFTMSLCNKNGEEFKFGSNITIEYNGFENMAYADQCGSQWPAVADTIRLSYDAPGAIFALGSTTTGSWTGGYQVTTANDISDNALCLIISSVIECQPITSYNNGAKTFVVSAAFSTGTGSGYTGYFVYTGSAAFNNFSRQYNVYKNQDSVENALATSVARPSYGNGSNHTFTNNLSFNDNSYFAGRGAFNPSAGDGNSSGDASFKPTTWQWDHNTVYTPYGRANGPFFYIGGNNPQIFDLASVSNNMFGTTGNGAFNDAFEGDSYYGICETANGYFTNSNFLNNIMPSVVNNGTCSGGNTSSGNIASAWADQFGGLASVGIYKCVAGASCAGGATDGKAIGVDHDKLARITSVAVKAQATHALLTANLSGTIADAGSTQPCTLEVSSDSDLWTDLNDYSVINALNPAYFKQADSSAHTNVLIPNPVVSNGHLSMPIGINATVTDDNGDMRNLALTASTLYYYRLMCYGDTVRGTFTTAASDSAAASFSVNLGAVTGTATATIFYGTTPGSEDSVAGTVSGGRVTATIPTAGDYTYWFYELYDSMAATIYQSPNRIYVPQ